MTTTTLPGRRPLARLAASWRRLRGFCRAVRAAAAYWAAYDVGHGRGCRCEPCRDARWDDRNR